MKAFSTHLTWLRERAGITMYRLAFLSGISKEGIGQLEKGRSEPKLSTLVKLAEGLGIPTWEMLPDWPGEKPRKK